MEGIAIFDSDLALAEVNDASLCKNPSEKCFKIFICHLKALMLKDWMWCG